MAPDELQRICESSLRSSKQRGELKRVTAPVSLELEITEITDRMVKSGGPALLFENVDGGTTPLLINIFGTHRRTALALGVEHIEELSDRVRGLFKMVQGSANGACRASCTRWGS